MPQNVKHVVFGAPKAGGAVWSAALGSTAPTDATSALDSALKSWGYVSDSGIAENGSVNTTNIKAYGGTTVATIEGGNDVTYTFTPLEYTNPTVQEELYGTDHVKSADGSLSGVEVTDDAHERRLFVFEHILSNGMVERDVLPCGQVTGIGTNTYSSSAALGPEVTVTPYPDENGVKVYKYFATVGAASATEAGE